MRIFDREKNLYLEEKEFKKNGLEFLYKTLIGRILLKLIFTKRYYSELVGLYMRSRHSVKKIAPFITEYSIGLSDCEKTDFSSFDDFFTRKRKYKASEPPERLIAAADGRLSSYRVENGLTLRIKNSVYTLAELTGEKEEDLLPFDGGICLVYRLAVEDYHRYVFIDEGRVVRSQEIKGELHTVRPVSEKYRVFSRNHRICTLMDTANLGRILQVEVGAIQVGRITNHSVERFKRLDEKGYFSYGGSTVIQIFEKGAVELDRDIAEKDCEVLVRIGEGIGTVKGRKTCSND